jgi:lysophospholipase L1-like esterase
VKPTLGQKLLLAGFGLFIALAIGECTVRILGLAPDIVYVEKGRYRLSTNPKIGYEPVPDLDYDGKSLHFYDYRGASNSLGYRDYEHERSKPDGRYRIAVIGDSIAAGHYIPKSEQMFSSVLEAELKNKGIDAEVMNFAVSGYNTQQEVETLAEKGLAFDPDLVLVSYCLNDRERNDGGILATLVNEAKGKSGVGVERSWLHKSALFRVLWYRVLKKHEDRPDAYAGLGGDTVEPSLDRLGRMAKENGFAVMVAIFPDLTDLSSYRFQDQHQFVDAIADRNQFRVLDLLEPFRACGGKLGHDRYHPNVRGHACAGEAMAEAIAPLAGGGS